MNTLTNEEQNLLSKVQRAKQKHRLRQRRYVENQKAQNPNYNSDQAAYMRRYNAAIKEKYMTVEDKLAKERPVEPPKAVQIPNTEVPKVDRRTKKGKAVLAEFETRPAFETRRRELSDESISTYIRNLNTVQKELLDKPLRDVMKKQITKLLKNVKGPDAAIKTAIISELAYLKDIDAAIQTLRQKNPKNNTFKAKLQAIVAVTSHIPAVKDQYQKVTKLAIQVNDEYEAGRSENVLKPEDEGKLIDVDDQDLIWKNIQSLSSKPKEQLIYAIYTLIPPRRVKDYYLLRPTTSMDFNSLDDEYNYLVLNSKPMKLVFNNYKTRGKFKQQVFDVPDKLAELFKDYVQNEKLDSNHFIFHQDTDKRLPYAQSNFSELVKKVFRSIYDVNITVTNIRQSWATAQEGKSLTQRQQTAKAMAHNVDQQLRYAKFRQ